MTCNSLSFSVQDRKSSEFYIPENFLITVSSSFEKELYELYHHKKIEGSSDRSSFGTPVSDAETLSESIHKSLRFNITKDRDEVTVHLFIEWLNRCALVDTDGCPYQAKQHKFDLGYLKTMDELLALYTLAIRYDIPQLRRDSLDAWYHLEKSTDKE